MSNNQKGNVNNVGTGVMASYGTGKFVTEFFSQAFGVVVWFFYEDILGLAGFLAAFGFIMYSIWNAINDPLVGYLTEKPTPLSKKYGRRFPWIFICSILWVLSFALIFLAPSFVVENELFLLCWMIFTTCLFDTLYSIFDVNYQSIFPDKFRNDKERNKAVGIATIIGVFGIAVGSILPTIISDPEITSSYVTNGIIFSIIGFFLVFLLIPGVKENPDMIKRYIEERDQKEQEGFISQFIKALKQRNFLAWIILYFFYQSAVISMTGSILFIEKYVIFPNNVTIIMALYLVGALIGVPLWLKINKRFKSNQNMLMASALCMAIVVFPMTFIGSSYEGFMIFLFLFGLGFGGYWMIMTPALADVIDEIVLKAGKRNDGIYMGFRAFFGRLAFVVQALSFWIVHEITGFVANSPSGVDSQTPTAMFGIHIHMALIPAILLIIGILVFWRLNDLNTEKVAEIKSQLIERGL
ncbi:MAG: MFS transporter [Candidatus Hodarchaeales archaeon]|jgi:GPH family glycoside/pentoside/hexuronide:cation symporter